MAEEFKSIVDSSYDNEKFAPFWIYTSDYVFGMVPIDPNGERWNEVSYTFEDPDEPFSKTERSADLSYQFLLEEVVKGVAFYIEDLNVYKLKDFAKTIEAKPGPEKLNAIIAELTNNSGSYSSSLPIIKSKDDLGKLKEKL